MHVIFNIRLPKCFQVCSVQGLKVFFTLRWGGMRGGEKRREARIKARYFHLDDGDLTACRQLQRAESFLQETQSLADSHVVAVGHFSEVEGLHSAGLLWGAMSYCSA